ncbi:uncharacterized protein BJ212DRAFT_1474175 [Suillus subaureus]|uniref:Uncharacterized protein n=1 Tax=Suillus subaureus TaxID=48587 RepID=A0A9P7JJP4_9AGAM|nr:uncharacterized protein BJ212DRAFT_1474175 [Suillus subaureus]KAG1826974.1 hypothetical protein BJ212DRAFT_1474175 [Suillus subaureus]
MDFDIGMSVLDTLQNQVGTAKEHKNMIVKDITGKMIRIVRNVFEKRERIVLDSPHGQSLKGAPQVDKETQNWPIAEELNVINGTIVEVHFGIFHWHISDFDSFQANIEKIIILKLGYGHHTSNYKHPHPSDAVLNQRRKNHVMKKMRILLGLNPSNPSSPSSPHPPLPTIHGSSLAFHGSFLTLPGPLPWSFMTLPWPYLDPFWPFLAPSWPSSLALHGSSLALLLPGLLWSIRKSLRQQFL